MSGNSAAHTPNLLSSVLLLLDLLSGALSLLLEAVLFCERVAVTRWRLGSKKNLYVSNSKWSYSGKSVLGLELLGGLKVVVDQSETSGASTTEDGAETK